MQNLHYFPNTIGKKILLRTGYADSIVSSAGHELVPDFFEENFTDEISCLFFT